MTADLQVKNTAQDLLIEAGMLAAQPRLSMASVCQSKKIKKKNQLR
jgi:hypothetical protein